MAREILFRGQTRKRGEKVNMAGEPIDGNWVYGGIFQGKGDKSIIYTYEPVEKRVVYSDTVGQYTGLTDKNGVKIFEGDIVRWTWEPYVLVSPGGYYRYPHGTEFEVRLLESGFMLCKVGDQMPDIPNANGKVANYEFWNYHRGLEIVGNIHDTLLPEPPKEDDHG